MSVIVIGHVKVDPANLEKLWQERGADFKTVSQNAKAAGAIHHQWAFGDGEVVLIDEWPDAASFQKFFDAEAIIPDLMMASGAQGPPTFEILESKTAPDTF